MAFNLNACNKSCFDCIKGYKKKHSLIPGDSFKIPCNGIPQEYISPQIAVTLTEEQKQAAIAILDPVTWAATNLDWHCLDADGEIWKRKNPEEYYDWIQKNPGKSILGKSRYHRPYQAEMLRCTAKRKIYRIGRQAGKSESIAVSILHHLFTKPGKAEKDGFVIILITPYQTQIELIFTRITELIRSNKDLENSIARAVKAPNYSLELHNGSVIRGFTAGSKSGNNADAVRGQHGDMLIFDEADRLSAGDMESAMAITTNSPNASVWMSSTPTGKREKFWQICQSKSYREFHYSSRINPFWNAEMEEQAKEAYSEIGFKHEVLADFGEQEEGVFQNTYIQAAKANYKYGDYPKTEGWTYTIGVDWNDVKNGTTIAVLGFNHSNNHFFVVDRAIVSRIGWTQLSACEKIAEFNRVWRPVSIYVDSGYGATQIEVLRKFGWDSLQDKTKGPGHPDSKIKDILKEYNFSSKIEIHDLFTQELISKPAKAFLVENAVRRFETSSIHFPETDKVLENQLQNYIIDRITQAGTPVYKPQEEAIGDHTLDAVMLALVAFTLTKTPLGAPIYTNDIAFTGQFGQKVSQDYGPGELIITNDKSPNRQTTKPDLNRTGGIVTEQRIIGKGTEIPANHLNAERSTTGIWDWPGFSRDAPRPKARTLEEAFGQARNRITGGRTKNRPTRRKNI